MPRRGGCGRAAPDVLPSAGREGLPMLGPPKARHVDRPVRISLEDLVPLGHFYRHLEQVLDLRFVRELVRDRYAPGGRPRLAPVVYFKLQLIFFFEGLRSERKLVETASLNLAHRWYLGYAFDEPLPDHSTLTKIRQRPGVEVFRHCFDQVVELCRAAGLVRGQELFFDATRVRANADVDSVVPRLGRVVGDHLEALFPEGGAASDGRVEASRSPGADPPAEGVRVTGPTLQAKPPPLSPGSREVLRRAVRPRPAPGQPSAASRS
jgi:transposase